MPQKIQPDPRPRAAALAAALLALSACYEEKDERLSATEEAAEPRQEDGAFAPMAAESRPWLEVGAQETPLDFLSRVSGEPAARLEGALRRATALYRESERMIANRLVQLWLDLAPEKEARPPLSALMKSFTEFSAQPEQSLGPLLQHYRVLRAAGYDHAEAVVRLRGQGP